MVQSKRAVAAKRAPSVVEDGNQAQAQRIAELLHNKVAPPDRRFRNGRAAGENQMALASTQVQHDEEVQDVKTPTKKCGKGEKNESKWEAKNESKIALEVEGDEE